MLKTSMGKGFFVLFITVSVLIAREEPLFDSMSSVSLQGSFPAHADPSILFTVWDGDGLKDMLAAVYHGDGNSSFTRVQWYKNKGSKSFPEFVFQDNLKDVSGEFITPYWY